MKQIFSVSFVVVLLLSFVANTRADCNNEYKFVLTDSIQTNWNNVKQAGDGTADWCQIIVKYDSEKSAIDLVFQVNKEYIDIYSNEDWFVAGVFNNGAKLTDTGNVGAYIDPREMFQNNGNLNFVSTNPSPNGLVTDIYEANAKVYFADGYSWENFETEIESIFIIGHLQSLNGKVAGVSSINGAKFTCDPPGMLAGWEGDEDTTITPEPATLLMLGLGAVFAARRRLTKK